jgi:hypothetical protein
MRFNYSHVPKQFGRRNTFLRGTIYTPGNAPVPCAVRDFSASGARLLVPSSSPLPARFRLLIEASGFESDCAILERSDDSTDVVFV